MKTLLKYVAAIAAGFTLAAGAAHSAPALQRLRQLFATGSATLPSISFHADPDTGVYRSAANTVGVAAGGSAALTVASGTAALKATGTNSITSDTVDATTSTSVAALTIAPTVNIGNSDLVLEINDSAGTSLFTVNEAGAVVATGGLTFGGGSALSRMVVGELTNLDITSAAANVAVGVTGTLTGAAVGDACTIGPMQDDAAWDEGSLTCFVESTDTIKVVYHADATGGDPAATNDYKIVLLRP